MPWKLLPMESRYYNILLSRFEESIHHIAIQEQTSIFSWVLCLWTRQAAGMLAYQWMQGEILVSSSFSTGHQGACQTYLSFTWLGKPPWLNKTQGRQSIANKSHGHGMGILTVWAPFLLLDSCFLFVIIFLICVHHLTLISSKLIQNTKYTGKGDLSAPIASSFSWYAVFT